MAEPVPPFYLFLAKLLVVTKLVLLTQAFVFVLYWVLRLGVRRIHSAPAGHYHLLPGAQCTGRPGRGGGAAAIFHGDPQLCLAGVFGLAGGVSGMLLASRGYWYAWPYCLMQRGMKR